MPLTLFTESRVHKAGAKSLKEDMRSHSIVGFLAIRLIRYLVLNDKFIVFSYYTFALGAVVLLIGIAEKIMGITFIF